MLELLFVLGLMGLASVWIAERVYSFEAFPLLLVVGILWVLVAAWSRRRLLSSLHLRGIGRRCFLLPPERFYWELRKGRLALTLGMAAGLLVASLPGAVFLRGTWGATALAGVAAFSGGIFSSHLAVGWRMSRLTGGIGARAAERVRGALYWLSDNPEFLDCEELPAPVKRKKEAVY